METDGNNVRTMKYTFQLVSETGVHDHLYLNLDESSNLVMGNTLEDGQFEVEFFDLTPGEWECTWNFTLNELQTVTLNDEF